jgi:hypothetical protein
MVRLVPPPQNSFSFFSQKVHISSKANYRIPKSEKVLKFKETKIINFLKIQKEKHKKGYESIENFSSLHMKWCEIELQLRNGFRV